MDLLPSTYATAAYNREDRKKNEWTLKNVAQRMQVWMARENASLKPSKTSVAISSAYSKRHSFSPDTIIIKYVKNLYMQLDNT